MICYNFKFLYLFNYNKNTNSTLNSYKKKIKKFIKNLKDKKFIDFIKYKYLWRGGLSLIWFKLINENRIWENKKLIKFNFFYNLKFNI